MVFTETNTSQMDTPRPVKFASLNKARPDMESEKLKKPDSMLFGTKRIAKPYEFRTPSGLPQTAIAFRDIKENFVMFIPNWARLMMQSAELNRIWLVVLLVLRNGGNYLMIATSHAYVVGRIALKFVSSLVGEKHLKLITSYP